MIRQSFSIRGQADVANDYLHAWELAGYFSKPFLGAACDQYAGAGF